MFSILWHDTLDSTNLATFRQMGTLDNLSVLAAREQTAGRGQRGNRWLSAPGMNLTFSVLLRFGEEPLPPLPVSSSPRLNEVASVAVRDYLRTEGCPAVVKWPNDIYCGRRKVCGILIENGLGASGIAHSVVGIGINLNQRDFGDVANATSLSLETGRRFDLERSLEKAVHCLEERLPALFDDAAFRQLHADYLDTLFQRGEAHPYRDLLTGEAFRGVLEGVDAEGKAVVTRCDGGTTASYGFKELGYIL